MGTEDRTDLEHHNLTLVCRQVDFHLVPAPFDGKGAADIGGQDGFLVVTDDRNYSLVLAGGRNIVLPETQYRIIAGDEDLTGRNVGHCSESGLGIGVGDEEVAVIAVSSGNT